MKKMAVLCAVVACGILALAVFAVYMLKPTEVVLLDPDNLPKVDTTAIDDLVKITGIGASENRLMLILKGTAKKDLGTIVSLNLVRYKGKKRLPETRTAFIVYAGAPKVKMPEVVVFEPRWKYNDQGEKIGVIGPGGTLYRLAPDGKTLLTPEGRPLKDEPTCTWGTGAVPDVIEAGDPIKIEIDATIEGGRITKLVLVPMSRMLDQLDTMPEFDTSAIDYMVEMTEAKLGPDRRTVILQGTARQALGYSVALDVTCYNEEGVILASLTGLMTYPGGSKAGRDQAIEPVYNKDRSAVIGPGGVLYPLGADGKTPVDAEGKYITDLTRIYGLPSLPLGGERSTPPADWIAAGDPVKIQIDATPLGNSITKLVLAPKTVGPR